MKHVEAGLLVGSVVLFTVLIVTALNHFIGTTGTAITGMVVAIAFIVGAIVDYLTEKE